jgi:hypothetical protein
MTEETVRVGEGMDQRQQQIAFLGSWRQIGHVIHALAELSVADALASGPRTVADLATTVRCDESALYRVLRCAAAYGVFTEQQDGTFAMTPLAEGPSNRRCRKRLRHLVTVCGQIPNCAATSWLARSPPSSAQPSTIRHRNARACDDFARRDQRTSVSRSSSDNTSDSFGRPRPVIHHTPH